MIKISTANEFIQKKITRNNVLINMFKAREEMVGHEITVKRKLQEFYMNQQSILLEMNDIETIQSTDYMVSRHEQTNSMMKSVGVFKPTAETLVIINRIKTLRAEIKESIEIVNNIQALIPNTGVVTNYTIKTSNPNQTCASAERGLN